jgi:hypothetical protein
MARGFVYLVAVMDWFSRRVLAKRLSIGMESEFCVEALQEALDRHGQPEVFNNDQGVQFTSGHLKCAVIMDVEPTTAVRQAEVAAAKTMIARTAERLGVEPERLVADTGYGSAEMLAWLMHERTIEPHVPVFDKSTRTDGTFSRADFAYDHAGDIYMYPSGKRLITTGTLVNDDATLVYRASKLDCAACALKPRCCPNAPARTVPRSIHGGGATWPATSPRPTPTSFRGASGRKSRCGSPHSTE